MAPLKGSIMLAKLAMLDLYPWLRGHGSIEG